MEIVHRIIHQRAEEKGEELVVLTQVLAHDLTVPGTCHSWLFLEDRAALSHCLACNDRA